MSFINSLCKIRHSSTSNGKSPLEVVFCTLLDYQFLKVFGCICFQYLRPYDHHKINFRSQPSVFLGYSQLHHGYIYFDTCSGRLYIARHVQFDETKFPFANKSILGRPPPVNMHLWYIHLSLCHIRRSTNLRLLLEVSQLLLTHIHLLAILLCRA